METFKTKIIAHLKTDKLFYSIIGFLVLLTVYAFISKGMAASRHANALVETKHHYQVQAQLAVAQNAKAQLSLLQKTFVWAVRSALIRGNLDEVNQYFNEFIKEENVKEVVLAGQRGEILVSTNKKHEGKPFIEYYPEIMLQTGDVYFQEDSAGYMVASPVLSLNTKLGTLFVTYHADNISFDAGENVILTDTISANPNQ